MPVVVIGHTKNLLGGKNKCHNCGNLEHENVNTRQIKCYHSNDTDGGQKNQPTINFE